MNAAMIEISDAVQRLKEVFGKHGVGKISEITSDSFRGVQQLRALADGSSPYIAFTHQPDRLCGVDIGFDRPKDVAR